MFENPPLVPNYKGTKRGRGFDSKQKKRARRQAKLLNEFGVKNILDYGCSTGQLFNHFEGVGVEVNDSDRARRDNVYTSLRDVPQRKYDCVTLSHVLEHIAEPIPLLKQLSEFAPMLYVEVPSDENPSSRSGYGHILVFDKPALEFTLNLSGYTVSIMEYTADRREIFALAEVE